MDAWSIGVDGGGTHVGARLFRGAETIAFASGPAVNPRIVGCDVACERIAEAVLRLRAHCPNDRLPDLVACGIAGTGDPLRRRMLKAALDCALDRDVFLFSDAEAALFAVGEKAWTMIVIAGTGSIALARGPSGTIVREGGLGAERGDPGSATRIGHDALDRVARADISAEFARELSAAQERGAVAELARIVDRRAGLFDRAASAILESAGTVLADQAFACARKADASGEPSWTIAWTGGVLSHSAFVRDAAVRRLSALGLRFSAGLLEHPAEIGAVRAARAAGFPRAKS
jgi:N-acetylglucosamine kinase-like BadF-type ATPase